MPNPSKSLATNEHPLPHTLSIIGPGCRPLPSNKGASNTTIHRWLSRIALFVLVAATFATVGSPVQAQRSSSGAQGAPPQEPGNILPANHDAAFDAATARRT